MRRAEGGAAREYGGADLSPQAKPCASTCPPCGTLALPALTSAFLLCSYPLGQAGLRISTVSLPMVPFPVPMICIDVALFLEKGNILH